MLDVELVDRQLLHPGWEWLGSEHRRGRAPDPQGVELALADPRRRLKLYAEAVWRNDFARALLAGQRSLPDADTIARFIVEQEPGLASSTARRRASAVRSPSSLPSSTGRAGTPGHPARPALRPAQEQQAREEEPVNLKAGRSAAQTSTPVSTGPSSTTGSFNRQPAPSRPHRRRNCPLGPYAEMAVRRGDARRQGDASSSPRRRQATGARRGRRPHRVDGSRLPQVARADRAARGEVQDLDERGRIGAR